MVEDKRDRLTSVVPFEEVRWVWIDLDDTLIDFHANSRAALAKLYNIESLDSYFIDEDVWISSYEAVNKPLWQAYAAGDITVGELRLQRFLKPLLDAGCAPGEAMQRALRYDNFYLDLLAAEKRVMPGAHDLLKLLRARGYKVGVLSNGFSDVQRRKMTSAGLSHLVDLVVLSDEAGAPKPHADIFRYAMERAGDSSVSHHVMIGDNLSADVGGALASGWHAIWYNPENKPGVLPAGSVTVRSLWEVAEMFPSVNNVCDL